MHKEIKKLAVVVQPLGKYVSDKLTSNSSKSTESEADAKKYVSDGLH